MKGGGAGMCEKRDGGGGWVCEKRDGGWDVYDAADLE